MANVKVRYLGTKKGKTVQFPVPFVSLSEKDGDVTFAGQGDVQMVPEAYALALVDVAPQMFELVSESKKSDKQQSLTA